ncbi:p450 domain-containing protein [Cephalotus follicularis]|uniref:p450 domain-containing protein n=1 Tax=Cephalotus follicularis TaxID=3775 RepID=A0A1Q3CHA0_CEPFO|nr:p450 domain-containing protein [Cephalotus follicularis]
MEFFISCLLCLLFTFILVGTFHSKSRTSKFQGKLPPGPVPLPILGNFLELGDKPHVSLANLAKAHGPIMSLKLGQVTTIVFSSATMANEVLQKHDLSFSNRLIGDAVKVHHHYEDSIVWLPVAKRWRNLRKICNSHIFSKQKLDEKQYLRRKKVQELVAYVKECCQAGCAVDIGQVAFNTMLNLLSSTTFSVDLADPRLDTAREFKEVVWRIMEEAGKPNLGDYFPVLKKIDPQGIRRRLGIHVGKLFDMFDGMTNERLQLRKSPGYSSTNDVLDTLLNITEDNSEAMDKSNIKHLLLDLFVAGTDTTSTTLEWAMAELLGNPKTLAKAQEELEQNIGKSNQLEESDIPRLPYLQAIIKENFRLHPTVPLLLPRKAGEDVEMNGYIVPKGAQIIVNAWNIGRDPSSWEDPNKFMPESFLGSDIEPLGRNFELIPFGGGRRVCPGLPLALRMLPLMLGTLVHSFNWKLEEGVKAEEMDMEEKFGISLAKAQPLRAVPLSIQ